MKTSTDPRHLERQKIVQELFAWNVNPSQKISPATGDVLSIISDIDTLIEKYALRWKKEKINAVDIAVLRLAVFEIKFKKKEPPKVIIDEAIELAKEYGSESSAGFVNGVLGTLIKEI